MLTYQMDIKEQTIMYSYSSCSKLPPTKTEIERANGTLVSYARSISSYIGNADNGIVDAFTRLTTNETIANNNGIQRNHSNMIDAEWAYELYKIYMCDNIHCLNILVRRYDSNAKYKELFLYTMNGFYIGCERVSRSKRITVKFANYLVNGVINAIFCTNAKYNCGIHIDHVDLDKTRAARNARTRKNDGMIRHESSNLDIQTITYDLKSHSDYDRFADSESGATIRNQTPITTTYKEAKAYQNAWRRYVTPTT